MVLKNPINIEEMDKSLDFIGPQMSLVIHGAFLLSPTFLKQRLSSKSGFFPKEFIIESFPALTKPRTEEESYFLFCFLF